MQHSFSQQLPLHILSRLNANRNGRWRKLYDLLDYARMVLFMDMCYSGMHKVACQLCASNCNVELFQGTFVRIKGQRNAAVPDQFLP